MPAPITATFTGLSYAGVPFEMDEAVTVPDLHLVPTQERPEPGDLAVMLTGGGARAAYQVGLLKGLARHFPDLRIDIITGVSAGAINAMYLAAATGSLRQKAHDLERLWIDLSCSTIYDFHLRALIPKWGKRSLRGLLDTQPLRELMSRVLGVPSWAPIDSIEDNIRRGDL